MFFLLIFDLQVIFYFCEKINLLRIPKNDGKKSQKLNPNSLEKLDYLSTKPKYKLSTNETKSKGYF